MGASSRASDDSLAQVNALRQLMGHLPKNDFEVVETRLFKHIRIPIVIVRYISASGIGLEVDISVGVRCNGAKKGFCDRLVRRMLSHVPKALPMVRVVKQWAKTERLNKAFDGYLNSLGWTLLVLFWFLDRGHIAAEAAERLLAVEDEDVSHHVTEGECSLPSSLPGVDITIRAPSVAVLADFFSMIAGFGDSSQRERPNGTGAARGISLVDAAIIDEPDVDDPAPFFIEDPAVRLACGQRVNVGRCLRPATWRTITRKCRTAAQNLHSGKLAATSWARRLLVAASVDVTSSRRACAAKGVHAAVDDIGDAADQGGRKRKRSEAMFCDDESDDEDAEEPDGDEVAGEAQDDLHPKGKSNVDRQCDQLVALKRARQPPEDIDTATAPPSKARRPLLQLCTPRRTSAEPSPPSMPWSFSSDQDTNSDDDNNMSSSDDSVDRSSKEGIRNAEAGIAKGSAWQWKR